MMRYTPEQHAWMEENWRRLPNADVVEAFNSVFGTSITYASALSYGKNRRWRKDPGVKELAIRKALGYDRYTDEWRQWFISFVPGHQEREISAECEKVWGFPLSEGQIGNWKTRFGVKSGTHGGRFPKGCVPANKGKTWDEMGISPKSQAKIRETCFKKGLMPHNAKDKPLGMERITKDGYVEVKVRLRKSGRNGGKNNDNWRMKHHIVWEDANGRPVPPHTMIVFADGDRRNFDPDNLVAVPRRIWVGISNNGLAFHDAESLKCAMAIAGLKSAAHSASCKGKTCKVCGKSFDGRYPHQRTCDKCLGRR